MKFAVDNCDTTGCLGERELSVEQFAAVYDSTAQGHSRAVLVTGPVASGKTELVQDLLRRARDAGALVLEAVGLPVTRTYQLGVLRQLMQALPAQQTGPLQAVLTSVPGSAVGPLPQPEFARVALAFRDAVQAVAGRTPVVLCIDDIQYADTASLEVVTALRGWGLARVLSVLVERTGSGAGIAAVHRCLAREQDVLRLPLCMLSERGTAALIARHLGGPAGERLARRWHPATGGNPVLINALLDEAGWTEPSSAEPPTGVVFARSVMHCLFRAEPAVLRVAQALAVLGGRPTAALVGRLLSVSVEHAEHGIGTLTAMGLVADGRLRHPAIGAAVRGSLPLESLAELRLRAARMRYNDGAHGTEVAELIEAAGGARGEWAVHVLREAATKCLDTDDCEQAVRYLRLAEQACENRQQRTEVTAALARATWRLDPQWAVRYVPELVAMAQQGLLRPADSLALAEYLLWWGRPEEALDVLADAVGGPLPADDEGGGRPQAACPWLRRLYPLLPPADPRPGGAAPLPWDGPESLLLARAEGVLQPGLWDDESAICVVAAVVTSTYAGRPDDAERLLARLVGRPTSRGGPTWQAVASAGAAEIALRRGRPEAAERLAREAFHGISYEGWGVMLGGPLSTLIAALTAQRKLEQARVFLDVPLPQRTLCSLAGPHVLLARAQYHLAAGQAKVALADFTRCGKLLENWKSAARPSLPWRDGAADALLRLGRTAEAGRLLEAQSAAAPNGGVPTQRALGSPRPMPGRRSVPAQRMAWEAAGEPERSASRSSASRSSASRPVPVGDLERPGVRDGVVESAGRLSRAELRVAALAQAGRSNREISQELHVTVSTVEQHLTRIYRKLEIPGRARLIRMATATTVTVARP
ncbi:LuxR family transcriptional regulator [Kitasatospora brasiliensis]|uniref:LuxR family transcriptional regulator n=1 Tax=Kitasatospora brasiliensis TaxID=3058040 RepID=UPI00292CE84C|nr:LuxR family transcriptional regulator [Kitasatospora sp. K002]